MKVLVVNIKKWFLSQDYKVLVVATIKICSNSGIIDYKIIHFRMKVLFDGSAIS